MTGLAPAGHPAAPAAAAVYPRPDHDAAALQAQIATDQLQLNDWVTCVSASTPRGKAEIAKLSGRINAAREQIVRLRTAEAAQQSRAGSVPAAAAVHAASAGSTRSGRVDLWV